MTYKSFDKALYDKYNTAAIKQAISFFSQFDKRFRLNEEAILNAPEAYKKYDFLMEEFIDNDWVTCPVETEVKKVWRGRKFIWDSIDVPRRKKDSLARYFCMFNSDLYLLAVIPMKKILEARVITKNTIYTQNEEFFRIPLSEFKFFIKKNGKWEKYINA